MDISSNVWALWIFVAVGAACVEMVLPYFTFIFASFGALVAAVVSLRFGTVPQALAFSVTMVTTMLLLRQRLLTRFHRHSTPLKSRTEALIGVKGNVTQAIDPLQRTGRVTVNGEDWAASCEQALPVGAAIEVVRIEVLTLIVKAI